MLEIVISLVATVACKFMLDFAYQFNQLPTTDPLTNPGSRHLLYQTSGSPQRPEYIHSKDNFVSWEILYSINI
jgi:hypothetical protein